MSTNNLPTQPMCWVPTCANQNYFNKKFYPLPPIKSKMREIWLALATKSTKEVKTQELYFCEDHFEAQSSDSIEINGISFTPNSKVLVPNKNMPDRICRTCNTFIDSKEPFFTMSSTSNSDIPTNVSDELQNIISVNPEPLNHVFKFCFKEAVIPTDPIPLICGKCHYHVWLFFAYKKRAIEVEDFLCKDMTPEKYGTTVLCRACPDSCSNFFPLRKDSDLGMLLQKMFVNNYSPDVVPLRVCLNCYNILQKLCEFYKNYVNIDEIMKRRALLNEKLKMSKLSSMARKSSTSLQREERESFIFSKQVEAENMALAKLMLQFGHSLKKDIHTMENWNPICIKLREQGINHKIPSLITNWKKLTKTVSDKVKNQVALSDLEKLVQQYNTCSNPALSIECFPLHKTGGQTPEYSAESSSSKAENKGVICWGSSAKPSTSQNKNEVKNTRRTSAELSVAKKPKNTIKIRLHPTPTAIRRSAGRPPRFTPQEKFLFVNSLTTEFNKLTEVENSGVEFWKSLVEVVAKKHMPGFETKKLFNLWYRLKISASVHEKDGSDPLDLIVWDLVQKHQAKTAVLKQKRKGNTDTSKESAIENKKARLASPPKTVVQSTSKMPSSQNIAKEPKESSTAGKNRRFSEMSADKKHKSSKMNNVHIDKNDKLLVPNEVHQNKDRQLYLALRETYNQLKKTQQLQNEYPKRIWVLILNKMYDEGFRGMSRGDAALRWKRLRHSASKKNINTPLTCEVRRFLRAVYNDANQINKKVFKKSLCQKVSTNPIGRPGWENKDKKILLQVLKETSQGLNDRFHWSEAGKLFNSRSENRRTVNGLRCQLNYQRIHLNKKIENKIPLNDLEREFKDMFDKMESAEVQLRTSDHNPQKIKLADETVNCPIVSEQIHVTKEDNPDTSQEDTKKRKISLDQDADSNIDIDSYNYVSLEDIRQSTSYDIPEFKFKVDPDDLECDENQVSTSTGVKAIDEEEENDEVESNEYTGGGSGDYVGADDLLGDDDLFDEQE